MRTIQSCHQELIKCVTEDCDNTFYHDGWQNPKRFCNDCIDTKKKIRNVNYHRKKYQERRLAKKLEWIPPKLRKKLPDIEEPL